jgi:hypothetical protein
MEEIKIVFVNMKSRIQDGKAFSILLVRKHWWRIWLLNYVALFTTLIWSKLLILCVIYFSFFLSFSFSLSLSHYSFILYFFPNVITPHLFWIIFYVLEFYFSVIVCFFLSQFFSYETKSISKRVWLGIIKEIIPTQLSKNVLASKSSIMYSSELKKLIRCN